MADPTKNVWPKTLRLRDTQLHDDLGGAGQRIYTTAGQGYEKREYVRADELERLEGRVAKLEAKIKTAHDALMNLQPHIGQLPERHQPFIDAHVDVAMQELAAGREDE